MTIAYSYRRLSWEKTQQVRQLNVMVIYVMVIYVMVIYLNYHQSVSPSEIA